jgi:hypothetical protein
MSTNKTYNKVQLDVKFTQAASRANLTSEENISISFGKLSKWYASLVPTGGSSGQFLGWNSDGTAKWVSNPNVDTKVTQSSSSTTSYRPLVLGAKNSSTVSELSQTVTDQTYTTTNMYAQPSTGTIFASLFNGVIYKSGGQWITARDNAPVYANKTASTGGSYYPAFFAKSKTGGWSMGVLGNSDTLYTAFTTDENYSASPQSNTNTYQIAFPSKSGTIALTSDIPSVPAYYAGDHLSLSSTTFSIAPYAKNMNAGDWNEATTTGWYMGSSCANAPSTAWWIGHVIAHNNKYCIQEIWQFTASTNGHKVPHKMRMYVNEVWGDWVDVTVGTQVPENAVFTDTKVNVTLATTTKAYLLGTTTTPTGTAQAVTSIADTGVYLGSEAGSLYAATFYENGTALSSKYAALSHSHDNLTSKALTATTFGSTSGNFFFRGGALFGGTDNADWVGIQGDATNDKFQLVAGGGNGVFYRESDDTWGEWHSLLTNNMISGSSGITVTRKTIKIGGDDGTTINTGVTISHSNSITAETNTVFKKFSYDANGHITDTAPVTASDIPSLNYVPNTQAGVNAAINLLSTGSSVPSLADYYVSQFASGGTTTTTYHRRPISALWNAFKGLITLTTTGSGNAVTAVSIANDGDNNRKITVTKGSTFSLSTHNHDSDYVKTFLSTNYDINQPGYYAVMARKNDDNPDIDLPTSNQWWHVLSMSWAGTSDDVNNWISQLAIPTYASKLRGLYWRTNSAANTELSADDWKRVYCEERITPEKTSKTRNILNLWGNTVGNNASELISGTAGVLSYGDAGPQINFSSGATIGIAQDSAIIWTDHDTAASGASWHFVSSQSDWNVISKRFHARTGISIGTDLPQTSYNLYVNGTTFHSDNITFGTASNIVVSSKINIYTRTTSTYSTLAKWSNGNTWGTRGAEIGYHNTGGDSTNPGTICVLPYQTDAEPWNGQVGLFIKKDHVYIDGVELSKSGHTHSYIPMSGSTDVTGNIKITKASDDVGFYAKRSDTGVEVWMGVGSGGTNHGIYSNKLGKWMMYGDATNVYLNGNATTASSWATPRTLTLSGQLTGSVSVKGDANMTLSGYLKKSFSVDDTSDFASYAWHKFAEITVTGAREDRSITFIVSKTWGAVSGSSGILTAHIRTGSTKIYESSQFQWNLAGAGIDPDDFVLVYTNTANTSCKVELWYKQTARYDGWIFTVLKEHNRVGIENAWTVYTASGHGSATHTAGTGTVTSTIGDIKNSANDVNVTQTVVDSTYTNYRPLLIGASNNGTAGFTPTTTTAGAYTATGIYCKPSAGTVYGSEFITNTYPSESGSSLSKYGLFLKSYIKCADSNHTVLQYSGYGVRTYSGKITSSDGMAVAVGCGGLTVLGGGESAHSLVSLISDDQKISGKTTLNVGGTLNTSFTGNTEAAIISADANIYLITNCQTIANRKPVCLDTSSYFYPGTNKTGSIGTSTYMWNTVYAATIYENGSSLGSKYGLNNQIYALSLTSDAATFNGTETLITSLPSSSGTSTPSYQRVTLNNFIKNVIGDLKEPVLYSNTTNPTASATVSFNTSLGTPKYLKLFITVVGGSTYSPSSGVTNVVDIDPLQYSNGCFVGHGSPGQSGVSTYLTYICIIHSETSGQHTYSCVKGAPLELYTGNTPSTISATVYITKVIAVY